MIKLDDALITQILPLNLASQPEVRALAWALRQGMDRISAQADKARLICGIDDLPEDTLDYLALDLRTPMYSEEYGIETKRELVKSSLLFYYQMGTAAAVNKMIQTIFPGGYIEEWQDYGGEPHYFRAKINVTGGVSKDDRERMTEAINSVKRLSSWLDSVTIELPTADTEISTGAAAGTSEKTHLPVYMPEVPGTAICAAGAGGTYSRTRLPEYRPEIPGARVYAGGSAGTHSSTRLPVYTPEIPKTTIYTGAGAGTVIKTTLPVEEATI